MSDYKQPDFYRFNEDSLYLVDHIKKSVVSTGTVLDLGAGCGVIGLELAGHYRPARLTLLELQTDFLSCLRSNIADFIPKETSAEVVIAGFSKWRPQEKFDLIACNPPYYLPQAGCPSQDESEVLPVHSFKTAGPLCLIV